FLNSNENFSMHPQFLVWCLTFGAQFKSGTDAASGLAIAILDDAKILIPLNQASKDYSLHSGKVPLTFYAQLRPVNSDVQSGKVNASATFVLHYD
ncbi:fimbrial protein, partial [Escherichia coli]